MKHVCKAVHRQKVRPPAVRPILEVRLSQGAFGGSYGAISAVTLSPESLAAEVCSTGREEMTARRMPIHLAPVARRDEKQFVPREFEIVDHVVVADSEPKLLSEYAAESIAGLGADSAGVRVPRGDVLCGRAVDSGAGVWVALNLKCPELDVSA